MRIVLHKTLEKKLRKLPRTVQDAYKKRRDIFLTNPFEKILNNHPLQGEYVGFWSINITGDYRVIYDLVDDDLAHFIMIGTHTELYE
ncbi:type II toxin-antitoxin system mRNA interferase toxin, RelE/StbE family [Candidatus Kaiserbacteria bacterium]|nr:type II toxin-antitoxin system mRNA interferase toxin, RelE/StbE family [Candidatus Kaiserbacteria bacterium]